MSNTYFYFDKDRKKKFDVVTDSSNISHIKAIIEDVMPKKSESTDPDVRIHEETRVYSNEKYILGKILSTIHTKYNTFEQMYVGLDNTNSAFKEFIYVDHNMSVGGSNKNQPVLETYKQENEMLLQLLEKSKKLIGELVDVIQHKKETQ